jgi:hypothetical protein
MAMTKAQAVLALINAVSEAIQELGKVPSGHLYASLTDHMSLDLYNQIIGILEKAGHIKVEHHLITWIKKD